MEVQSPQSVQINFNNKIITLHNVTIVKNPKIITIDATQYSNFLKGSPVKLSNGSTTTVSTPVKLQIPTLVPMKTLSVSSTNAQLKINPLVNSVVLNRTPVIMPVPKVATPQVIRTVQSNSSLQVKSTKNIQTHSIASSPMKLQALPVKQQPTVIMSPPETSVNNTSPVKIQFKAQDVSSVSTKIVAKQTLSKLSNKIPNTVTCLQPESTQTKVIISPPQKNKVSPCSVSPPPGPKRHCQKLEFHCIFCKDVFDDSNLLVEHMKLQHPESVRIPKEINEKDDEVVIKVLPESKILEASKVIQKISAPPLSQDIKRDTYNDEDDDESEVNDLIMDLEDTQDTIISNQTRSDTPESPEFEEHVPTAPIKQEPMEVDEPSKSEDDFDYENYEYFSSIMEPICELSCEDDSNDGVQDENEAMRLYREAMEVNYQQNGIKKRGRRKQRKPKPLVETSLNGILAGLLENSSIKVPPGPGRGRRKEINEQELEMDRSNGVCLFSCNKCDETFKYAGDLAKHVRSHTISSPYQCRICQRKFTHIGSLNTHLRIHSGERPYKCNQCDKSFTQSNSLMVHVKSHLSNKPYQCGLCNKGFLNASSLALHQKTHTGPAVPVICPIEECKKEFRDNNLLEEHMMTHRQSMLYQCSLCSEKFEQSCLLVQHVKSHIGDKPFQCNQCGKCFTQPGSLNTHLRIHTGEKPFECNICAKKFTQASSLSVHMKVHGEKEFKCMIEDCKKSYSQEAYLKKHMLKHIEMNLHDENNHIKQE